jgi:hypothetical protein
MADGVHHGVTRRDVLAKGAVAAGFVWSAPAIRSVRALQAEGTPPRTTTTSTPTVTTYTFAGRFPEVPFSGIAAPDCFALSEFVANANLSTLGDSSIAVTFCAGEPSDPGPPFAVKSGTFALSADGGSVSGTVTGGSVGPIAQQSASVHLDIAITAGTDQFAGASGTATIDAVFRVDNSIGLIVIQGEIEGTFDARS